MINKVVFISPELKSGSPVYERIMAYKFYFEVVLNIRNFEFLDANRDPIFRRVVKSDFKFTLFLVSMPSFKNWFLFSLPKANIVLDIRDGWSIAQAEGYGGLAKKSKFKAWLSKKIERFAICNSSLSVTCTVGLQQYLESVSGKKVILIPNGISRSRLDLIQKLPEKVSFSVSKERNERVFVCAGKFAEYGVDNAKDLLHIICERYASYSLKVKLIGSCLTANGWVGEFFSSISNGRGQVEIIPRMAEQQLFTVMKDADFGLVLLRDPSYEFGTKVYDYIALALPIVNYFASENNFTKYFDACLDVPFNSRSSVPEIRRELLTSSALSKAGLTKDSC